jgi:hypothetical protein
MGGKGSGGKRVGAGRKPKTARQHWLTGDAGKRGLSLVERPADAGAPRGQRRGRKHAKPVPPVIGAAGEEPPELTDAERVFWGRWAPRAKAIGTLTEESTPGFVLLCETASDAAQCKAEIYGRGIVNVRTAMRETGNDDEAMEVVTVELRAHPLWPQYRGLKTRLEMLMARYGLASMGKAPSAEKPDEDNERDQLRKLLAVT